ncbi:MAG: hypothetical protein M3R00_07450 [Pseudomonadota bacterium]|nr:hypothetical protein [Pseudomonadota bacterium]
MKLQSEQIIELAKITQFSYHEIMRIDAEKYVLFKHDDSSVNKAWPSDSGGYVSLFVIPYQSQQGKPSAQDRRAMYQYRPKASDKLIQNLPQWAAPKQIIREAGWKFHISISQNGENVSKAWNILVPILLKYKIGQTKVVKPENHQAANKIITVYTFSGGPALDQWASFLKDTEKAFRENGIIPGEAIYENHVTGSHYFYYRNDADPSGKYVADEYNFLYRVVDHIPVSETDMAKFEGESEQTEKISGFIIKLKGSDYCYLHTQSALGSLAQDFNIRLLDNIENSDQSQHVTISPISNRSAYVNLVVPHLDITIPSTNNVSKQRDPFESIDLTHQLAHSTAISKMG